MRKEIFNYIYSGAMVTLYASVWTAALIVILIVSVTANSWLLLLIFGFSALTGFFLPFFFKRLQKTTKELIETVLTVRGD